MSMSVDLVIRLANPDPVTLFALHCISLRKIMTAYLYPLEAFVCHKLFYLGAIMQNLWKSEAMKTHI